MKLLEMAVARVYAVPMRDSCSSIATFMSRRTSMATVSYKNKNKNKKKKKKKKKKKNRKIMVVVVVMVMVLLIL